MFVKEINCLEISKDEVYDIIKPSGVSLELNTHLKDEGDHSGK